MKFSVPRQSFHPVYKHYWKTQPSAKSAPEYKVGYILAFLYPSPIAPADDS